MLFRFIGQYTNGRTSVASCGVTFNGREPSGVTDAEAIRRLSGNIEFEAVRIADPLPVEAAPAPKKRGRPKKDSAA